MPLADHPLRTRLTNELHARPSIALKAPAQVGYAVLKSLGPATRRPADEDHAALQILTDHYGLPKPDMDASHFHADLGHAALKWEKHTEVATYTLFSEPAQAPFQTGLFDLLPQAWRRGINQSCLTSVLIDVRVWQSEEDVESYLAAYFNPNDLVASYVLDEAALIAGDFRMDAQGHIRFAVFVKPQTGPNRIGRIVQRLCEIETYKSLSMLGFCKTREIAGPLSELDENLTDLLANVEDQQADEVLSKLLDISGRISGFSSTSAYRFSATAAYEAIVHQRIAALRETRFRGRQTLAEFMMRRYNPAMRTVESTGQKLARMGERGSGAAQLLRTRVDVDRSEQSQKLLESMDRRADAQLQLQKTVEGLSVVAIGYYAVSLAAYLLAPLIKTMGWDKSWTLALASPPILLAVWWVIRSIRARH